MDLSVVIPVYNEEENIGILYSRLKDQLSSLSPSHEVIFVSDGTTDNSLILIKSLAEKDKAVKYIALSRNFGHQIAISAGLDKSQGRAVVIMDGDLQDPPELIPQLYKKYKEGNEVVYARRRNREEGGSWVKKIAYAVFYRLLKKITSVSIPLDTGDFRIIDRKIVDLLKQMPEREKFLRGQIAWIGFKQVPLEYDRKERNAGKPGYTYRKLISLALNGITSFSDFPLRFASIAGFIVSGIAFIMMLIAFLTHFIQEKQPSGWASLMMAVMFIGGIQLICTGIIGEYICKMSRNIRKRPLYIIDQSNIES